MILFLELPCEDTVEGSLPSDHCGTETTKGEGNFYVLSILTPLKQQLPFPCQDERSPLFTQTLAAKQNNPYILEC